MCLKSGGLIHAWRSKLVSKFGAQIHVCLSNTYTTTTTTQSQTSPSDLKTRRTSRNRFGRKTGDSENAKTTSMQHVLDAQPPVWTKQVVDIHMADSQAEAYVEKVLKEKGLDTSNVVSESDWTTLYPQDTGPEPAGMWPNNLLHTHRKEPLYTLAAARQKEGRKKQKIAEDTYVQVNANAHRLRNLWGYSNTAGVSWDELDELYIRYINEMAERAECIQEHKEALMEKAAEESKDIVRQERREFLKKQDVDVEILDENSPMILPRSLHRRNTKKLYRQWTAQYMKSFERGQLQSYMKAFVTEKVIKRETMERRYGLDKTEDT